jgi:hypothetical protein
LYVALHSSNEPDPGAGQVDNNDVLTDSNEESKLFST